VGGRRFSRSSFATAAAIAELRARPRSAAATAAVVLATTAEYGAWRLGQPLDDGARVRVGLVQGDVPNAWRADPRNAGRALRGFANATRSLRGEDPSLVVWPENAISVLLARNGRRDRGDHGRARDPTARRSSSARHEPRR
jgi:apolipoprotein N-acyltransferase